MGLPAPLALLCGVSFSLCSEVPLWGFHFVEKNLTWAEAQQFCRRNYHDLACVSSSEDHLRLPRPPGYSAPVWIGLYDDPTDLSQWKWSATNSSGSFENWRSDHPQYLLEPQQCTHTYSSTWRSGGCSSKIKAICYSGSSPKVFHESPVTLTWDDALTYCRSQHTDLAWIESPEENTAASRAAPWASWIGLSRSTGRWSDDRAVTFTAWSEPGALKQYHEPFCAAQTEENTWGVFTCQEPRPFYCQEESQSVRFVKMEFSGHGLDGPTVSQQVLDQIQKRFEEVHAEVRIRWKIVPEKQEEEAEPPEDCPTL